ncbi:MAG: hypothetical protein NW703_02300 [Nitrospiraceae bacterium]
MMPGRKRTLVARVLAGAGCVCGIVGFTMPPTAQMAGPADLDWFAAGTVLIVFAVYLLVDGAVAFQKAHSEHESEPAMRRDPHLGRSTHTKSMSP